MGSKYQKIKKQGVADRRVLLINKTWSRKESEETEKSMRGLLVYKKINFHFHCWKIKWKQKFGNN